jgi:hypothetical protein
MRRARRSTAKTNHDHRIAIKFMHYDFCRVHQTLRVTPAIAAGLTDHVWELSDLDGAHAEAGREGVGEREAGGCRGLNKSFFVWLSKIA